MIEPTCCKRCRIVWPGQQAGCELFETGFHCLCEAGWCRGEINGENTILSVDHLNISQLESASDIFSRQNASLGVPGELQSFLQAEFRNVSAKPRSRVKGPKNTAVLRLPERFPGL